jgi:hypothetical protein
MRKLLMASAAILGATGGIALAQTAVAPVAAPSQGQLSAPYGAGPANNNNNNSWGIRNTPSGSAAAGPLSTLAAPNTDAVPAPGQIVIRLNGRLDVLAALTYSPANTSSGLAAGSGTYKVNPLGFGQFMRLYPAFDGTAANGLHYGATTEIRQNFTSGTFPGIPNGNTAPSTTSGAASPSAQSSGSTLFVRRAFAYVSADQFGLIRVGQGDGVLGLFDPCIFISACWDAGDGNLDGGDIQADGTQAGQGIADPFIEQQGAEYDNSKIVYLSPQVFGFDFGAQFATSQGNVLSMAGSGTSCFQAGPQCVQVSSGSDPTRWYNQVGVGLRYMHNFGPVDFKAFGFYETASKENQTAGAIATTIKGKPITYDNLSWYQFGVAVTAMNITAAASYVGGAFNNQLAMEPSGGVPESAFMVGLTYANGPLTLGINFENIQDQGNAALTGVTQRHQYATSMGGAYAVAPGFQVFAEYDYQYRHQGNFNFATNTAGTGTADAQSNTFEIGTVMNW